MRNESAGYCLANFIQLLCLGGDVAAIIYAMNNSNNFLDGAILVVIASVVIHLVGYWIFVLICWLFLSE